VEIVEEVRMKYALLVYSQPGAYDALPEAEREAELRDYMALAQDSRTVESGQLQPVTTATTVRVDPATGVSLTTDGPFADTKEVFGGYYIVDAGDLDEAIELASRIPAARNHGSVEVRPVVER
jgi:hypothetical protein